MRNRRQRLRSHHGEEPPGNYTPTRLSLTPVLQPPKVDKITPNVVGDILENILAPASTGVSNESYRHDETALLDDEIKQIIKEMKYPPEQKSIICTQGVGDQLGDKTEVAPDRVLAEPVKRNTLERKNRLTNLVRNSKQMLSKLVAAENENEVRMTKSEEIHEKLLKVIDLEGDEHFVEPGSSGASGILHMPFEAGMDMVDLRSSGPFEGEEASGTDATVVVDDSSVSKIEKKGLGAHKKKWNFGAKIMRYIKRNKDDKK